MKVIDEIDVSVLGKMVNRTNVNDSVISFSVHAPVFVIKDLLKRTPSGVIVNDMIGLQDKIEPIFYMPSANRGFILIEDQLIPGELKDCSALHQSLATVYQVAWEAYENLLEYGIAEEVARFSLPTAIYTKTRITGDLNNLNNLCSGNDYLQETDQIIKKIYDNMKEMRK